MKPLFGRNSVNKPWEESRPADERAYFDAQAKAYWESIYGKRAAFDVRTAVPEKPTGPRCRTCNDMGLVRYDFPVEHPQFGKMFPCPDCAKGQDVELQRLNTRIKTAEVPSAYQQFTFNTWASDLTDHERQNKMLAYYAAWAFVEHPEHVVDLYQIHQDANIAWDERQDTTPKNSLVFHGPLGTGKTGLAVSIVNELITRGKTCLYIRARDLLREVQRRYGKDVEPSADDILRKFQTTPVLMIDEFTVENATNDRLEIIEDVIRYRYGNRLPTIATTNHDQDSFEAKWGGRTTDPFRAMAHWIYVGEPVLRRKNATAYEWQERADLR